MSSDLDKQIEDVALALGLNDGPELARIVAEYQVERSEARPSSETVETLERRLGEIERARVGDDAETRYLLEQAKGLAADAIAALDARPVKR